MPELLKSFYAPPERATEADLLFQMRLVAEIPIVQDIFDAIPIFIAILNEQRQIVFANKQFSESFNWQNLSSVLGKRPGEAISCLHANDCAGGCGTSEACSVCGAGNAILMSQKNGSAKMECRITLTNGDPVDIAISTVQHKIGGIDFTILSAIDISDQNRRKALEKIFFHDILNTAGALKGFFEIMKDTPAAELPEQLNFTETIVDHILDEIEAQKELTFAENNELQIIPSAFSTFEILKEMASYYDKQTISEGKSIVISKDAENILIINARTLLRRSIGNLIKNALEAVKEGKRITLKCKQDNDRIIFSVHNTSVLPQYIKLQIFQRSFSTKGAGRGLGTYSVKLLTERYLKGKAYFTSEEGSGTTFYLEYPLDIEK
jgi:signal transduction histidine kinase